jgi:hypothetical protein
MLNPSTADAIQDDPTIRRCRNFATAWGFRKLAVVNLFAWRATNPKHLPVDPELAVGPDNDWWIGNALQHSELFVCAWGSNPVAIMRANWMRIMAHRRGRKLWCLKETVHGHPSHPLYLSRNAMPKEWRVPTPIDDSVIRGSVA